MEVSVESIVAGIALLGALTAGGYTLKHRNGGVKACNIALRCPEHAGMSERVAKMEAILPLVQDDVREIKSMVQTLLKGKG